MASLQLVASSLQFVALNFQLWFLHSRSKRMLSHIRNNATEAPRFRSNAYQVENKMDV
jgi:hypothetical protein